MLSFDGVVFLGLTYRNLSLFRDLGVQFVVSELALSKRLRKSQQEIF